jgi:hypothetical protein
LARRRGRLANLHAAARDAGGTGGWPLIGCERGIAFDHRDPVDTDTEFLRCHLRDGDAQAGTEIDLAAEQRHPAIGMDGEETIDLVHVECLAQRSVAGTDLAESATGRAECHDQGPAGLEHDPAGEECRHGTLPAARMTARRMR